MHAFTDGRDTLPHAGAGFLRRARRDARRARRLGHRALLGDGPRPALGAHAARLRPARARRARRTARTAASRRCATPTSAARPTSSSSRRWWRRGRAIRPGRQRALLQLPARPDAPARRARWPSRGSARTDEDLPGWTGRGGAGAVERLTDADRVRGGLALSGRLRARAPATTLASVLAEPARASCTSPRPRSTRTSRTSSTAARRRRCGGERRELVPSPRDVPTYDHKPQMSAREAAQAFVGAWREDQPRSRSSTSPTPTWSATPA